MSGKWKNIILKVGILVIAGLVTVYLNYQRTTFGEVFVEKLFVARNDLRLLTLNMRDETSHAELVLSPSSAVEAKSSDGIQELVATLYQVYCGQNIEQADKLKISHFNIIIYSEKHELILRRILSPKHCKQQSW